jgi:hypothetical protein
MMDPFVYTLLTLLGVIPIGFGGFWFAGWLSRRNRHLPPAAK